MKTRVIKMMSVVLAAGVLLFACGKDNADENGNNNDGGNTPTSGQWVDLGLPSGLLWYSCNLGASAPEQYGDYYAWGETATKSTYSGANYRYYCNGDYGLYGFTATTLLPEEDAATQVLGNGARIPTKAEWQELINNTTATWTSVNGIYGRRFTAANGNSIFLPAAGNRGGDSLFSASSDGDYWSALLDRADPDDAWYFDFNSGHQYMAFGNRGYGLSVRAVRASEN